jgi:dihydropteroate synthase
MSEASVRLRIRGVTLDADPGRPLIMGIVNASPESFSNDGSTDRHRPFELVRRLVADGADIIDIGGESGVTNRLPLSAEAEIDRVVPVVEDAVATGAVVSVDTWKEPVAAAALEAGAHLINDVSGLRDRRIARLCAAFDAGLVIMHTRAAPKVKAFPRYDDVVDDVNRFLGERVATAEALGVRSDAIVVDPGPDFAKTPAETIAVLRALPRLHQLGRPVLLAASRKDFVGAITGRMPAERGLGTLAALAEGIDAGASIVRVHDVAATADFLNVRAVLRGETVLADGGPLAEHLRRQPQI